jgi:hypothetical protein
MFLLSLEFCSGQSVPVSPGSHASEWLNHQFKRDRQFHPSIKPFRLSADSLYNPALYSFEPYNFLENNQKLKVLPILETGYWQSLNAQKNLVHMNLGAEAFYNPHPKLTLHAYITERYTQLPAFQANFADSTGFIPRFGKYRCTFKDGYRFIDFRGSVHWSLNNLFSLEAGNERQFLGEGHRSLLFSDNAKPFPYVRASVRFWNLQYFHQVGFLRDINNATGSFKLERKNLVMHYLSWNISETFNLSLFETIIWRNADSTYHRGVDPNYFNPVIFLRPVEYAQGTGDNALIGLGGSWLPAPSMKIYGQLMIDEFSLLKSNKRLDWVGNKFGLQAGMKFSDLFGINNLNAQVEFNQVRPFTYSHRSSLQNYGNQFEPLAHPLGSNFRETLTKINYSQSKWYIGAKFIKAWKGENPLNINMGGDPYNINKTPTTAFGHEMLQGIKTNLTYLDIRAGYTILPEWGLALEGRLLARSYSNKNENDRHIYFQLGLNSKLHEIERFFY